MAVAVVSQAPFGWPGAYPLNSNYTFNATGGSSLVFVFITATSTTSTPVATYAGTTMTLLGQATAASGQGTIWAYGMDAPATGSNTLNISLANAYIDIAVGYVATFSGTLAVTPFGTSSAIVTTPTAVLAVTSPDASDLLLAAGATYYVTGGSLSSGSVAFTGIWTDTTSSTNLGLYAFDYAAGAAGAYGTTLTAPYNVVPAVLIPVRPSGGGPPPPAAVAPIVIMVS
jgi:hypothetical protein